MTWVTDPLGCGKCDFCGMDMDMDPFCVNVQVLDLRTEITGKKYPYGLDIHPARTLCQGNFLSQDHNATFTRGV